MTTAAQQRELSDRARQDVCAACGGDLLVAFKDGAHRLRCPACGTYDGETKPRYEPSLYERYKRAGSLEAAGMTYIEGQSLALNLANAIRSAESRGDVPRARIATLRQLEREMGITRKEDDEMTTALAIIDRTKSGLVPAEEAPRFVDLAKLTTNRDTRAALIAYVERSGLNPVAGEVTVYENKIMATIDGLRHLALASGLYDGEETYWLTAAEKAAEGYAENDLVCRVSIWRKGISRPFVGTGKANSQNPHRNSAVERAWTQRLSETRGYRHSWRKAFQDALSGFGLTPADLEEVEERFTPRITDVDLETGAYEPHEAPPVDVSQVLEGQFTEAGQGDPGEAHGDDSAQPEQLAAIKSEMERLGWTKEQAKQHVKVVFGIDGAGDLNVSQANLLLDYLQMDGKPKTA